MQTLQTDSLLQGGKYKIIKTLGQGGFGITYLAIQSGLERNVAVKEFFMKEFCERDESTSHVTLGTQGSRETVNQFRQKFLKEARNIAKLNHPNIVRIIDVFEENGTAYYVMDYVENGSLADKVKREGYLQESVATRYICQVAEALSYLHRHTMTHLDVKPGNIMVNENDEAVLIDFGVAKQYDAITEEGTTSTPVGISHGYSSIEQYSPHGVQTFSPQSDIYSLGATYYKLLTGVTPPDAFVMQSKGLDIKPLQDKNVRQSIIELIKSCMKSREERIQNINKFVECLNSTDESEDTLIVNADYKNADEKVPAGPKPHKPNYLLIMPIIMFVGIIAAFLCFNPVRKCGGTPLLTDSDTIKSKVDSEYIDLGLSVKWCTHNVGATKPEEFGDYYAWGEVKPKDYYNLEGSYKGSDIAPESGYDIVRNVMGENWRMPTIDEINELINCCNWTWVQKDGVYGYSVSSKRNGNSIFLPAAGWKYLDGQYKAGERCYYWSSTPAVGNKVMYLYFDQGTVTAGKLERGYGFCIRPVYNPPIRTYFANGVSFNMVHVKAGTFTMGATSDMNDPLAEKRPAHAESIEKDYYIGATEVTQKLWNAVMGSNPAHFKGDNRPIESISWNDCQMFISNLNSLTNQHFRLPTEKEWEFAARGGMKSRHYRFSGSNNIEDISWYKNNSNGETHEVAQKKPNELGIYDMSGNVHEWCSDLFCSYKVVNGKVQIISQSRTNHVYKGGSWNGAEGGSLPSFRSCSEPAIPYFNQGLRLAL